jgi:beta-lactamase regulating signal transducer with metallopeptidase domain
VGATITAAQWDAILAHELCHAERRDNLTAAIAAVAGPVLMQYSSLKNSDFPGDFEMMSS